MTEIRKEEIQAVMEYFGKNLYSARYRNELADETVQRCSELMRLDYDVTEVSNEAGTLSSNYPSWLLIPEYKMTNNSECSSLPMKNVSSLNGSNNGADQIFDDGKLNSARLRRFIVKARKARCRARFPVPVLMFNGKYLCRSSTLANYMEIFTRTGVDWIYGSDEPAEPEDEEDEANQNGGDITASERRNDIRLLKAFKIGAIMDFMVETKKVKCGVVVTSSEKVDAENRYSGFDILSLPYPGCEFFKEFASQNYDGQGLFFNWEQPYINTEIRIPTDSITDTLNIKWSEYQKWDLVKLTQNYLLLLLHYLQHSDQGILVHCISGWDRTPMFVSLVRMSLWADGVIHQSLNKLQMLYFTLAYDWLLFGHNLPDRLKKNEDIMFFCFEMLKHISGEEYSVLKLSTRSSHSSESSSIDVIRENCDSIDELQFGEGACGGSSMSLNSNSGYASGKSFSGLNGGGASKSISITGTNGNAARNGGSMSDKFSENGSINSDNGNDGLSSYSNDSGSSIGCLSHENSYHNVHWSPQDTRTSPVTVPCTDGVQRQRQESTSSAGSWQMVNKAGSYRREDNSDAIAEMIKSGLNNTQQCQRPSQHTSSGSSSASTPNHNYTRRRRLDDLRAEFRNIYLSSTYNHMPGPKIGTLLTSLLDKVRPS
ncbi:myotubularin-related protein 14 [Sabethes cyaneus]|uniref:myotubularin-related protein 14 n=1 Tax=Sabethes cyaneus TaxID=53552 RepID=UPI00237E3F66|nr:myotubularin-related protein 14 [Sabethes cyaneus]XP_053697731.1 myotubularin-related protein 14 [Sabethes cyaneus]